MKWSKANRQTFFFTLGLSLFLLLSAVGIVAVDVEGRRMSFGDETPVLERIRETEDKTELKIHLFGQEKELDVTKIDNFFIFLLDFSCIPHK